MNSDRNSAGRTSFRVSDVYVKLLLALVIVVSGVCGAVAVSTPAYAEGDAVRVLLDGRELGFDVDPLVENGRTLVPMRAIFEAFGAEVQWVQATSTINASKGDSYIKMVLGRPMIFVDGRIVYLDVAPKAVGGRTLVPLRAIGEALGLDVKWVQATRTVELNGAGIPGDAPVNIKKGTHVISNLRGDHYFEAMISGDTLDVNFRHGDGKCDFFNILLFAGDALGGNMFASADEKRIDYRTGEIATSFELGSSKYYYVEVWGYAQTGDYYNGTIVQGGNRLIIENTGDGYVFRNPVYDSSAQVMIGIGKPENHLNLDHLSAAERAEVKSLSDGICGGANGGYQKARLVHDWITKNIYYDKDYYEGRNADVSYDTPDVIKEKKTVCGGYSNLYRDMLRSQGIPCTVVIGASRDYGYRDFPEDPDHAWSAVYVDGRWIYVDTTWDTSKEVKNGVFAEGDVSSEYFDVDFEFMTLDHRFDEIEYDAWRFGY